MYLCSHQAPAGGGDGSGGVKWRAPSRHFQLSLPDAQNLLAPQFTLCTHLGGEVQCRRGTRAERKPRRALLQQVARHR